MNDSQRRQFRFNVNEMNKRLYKQLTLPRYSKWMLLNNEKQTLLVFVIVVLSCVFIVLLICAILKLVNVFKKHKCQKQTIPHC